jgi:hypothetical protein
MQGKMGDGKKPMAQIPTMAAKSSSSSSARTFSAGMSKNRTEPTVSPRPARKNKMAGAMGMTIKLTTEAKTTAMTASSTTRWKRTSPMKPSTGPRVAMAVEASIKRGPHRELDVHDAARLDSDPWSTLSPRYACEGASSLGR